MCTVKQQHNKNRYSRFSWETSQTMEPSEIFALSLDYPNSPAGVWVYGLLNIKTKILMFQIWQFSKTTCFGLVPYCPFHTIYHLMKWTESEGKKLKLLWSRYHNSQNANDNGLLSNNAISYLYSFSQILVQILGKFHEKVKPLFNCLGISTTA